MRFGAFVPQGWRLDLVGLPRDQHWPAMRSVAERIEQAGFESLWVYDHFHTVPMATQEPTYEAWTLMAALAVATDSVRLGQMCTCNSYRPPSYLAKVASSIDVISGGRLEMGIGAGWYEHEYRGYGYDFPKASVRIGMLREAVEVMLAMWTEDVVTYHGKYYQLEGAINQPKGAQEPHIPLWIAGGGEQLTLRVAARYANYTNFGGSPEEFRHKREVLSKHAADVGREFDEITLSSNFNYLLGSTMAEAESKVAMCLDRLGIEPDSKHAGMFRDNVTVGTPDSIAEELGAWQEAGCDYGIVYFPEVAYDTGSLDLFAAQVAPNV